jgi:hypothetical protein
MTRFERNVGSSAHTMMRLLADLRERYGGVADYLEACGVSTSQVEALKSQFLA